MAPTATQIEWQTSEIIKYLFEDQERIQFRCCEVDDGIETDGPEEETFDPVLIADKLKTVADALYNDIEFKAVLNDLKTAAAQEAVEEAFGKGMDNLRRTNVSQEPGVAPEMQLIQAAVAFGLYIKKSSPELKNKVQNAMTAYLNRNVGPWVTQQGGWNKVTKV